jgi:NADH:ubiquinone oxidoreductase subunit C
MKRIETTPETLKTDIGNFYNVENHHFIVSNIVDLGEKLELQWFFCDYEHPGTVTMFVMQTDPTIQIPSICEIVPSAWVGEAELVDLMGVNIENAKKGFVLEDDFDGAPLRKKK